ncbi:MAG: hypothetical protein K2N48_05080 [Muribaculaceae bacterium]|nr:hypothetical protein [Muribaculaceae bacterium]
MKKTTLTTTTKMKTKLIFYLLSLIFITTVPASAQTKFDIHPTKKIEANPINVAFMLAQETDTAKMSAISKYYGYEQQSTQNDFVVQFHPNGSIIRYTFNEATEEQPYPYVEVKSKLNSKAVESKLTDLKFKKDGSNYIRKTSQYARTIFNCKHGSNGYLIFHQTRLPKE